MKDLLDRLIHRKNTKRKNAVDELKRQINALYNIYAGAVGPEKLVVHAGRYDALQYIHDDNPQIKLIGLQRLILESKEYKDIPEENEIPQILDRLEDKLSEILVRQAVEDQLEKKISDRLEERHQEYVDEIRKEILEEESDTVETTQSRHRLESWRLWKRSSSQRRS